MSMMGMLGKVAMGIMVAKTVEKRWVALRTL